LRSTGGARRDRTADPLLAKQVLSQLSYGPRADTPFRHITPPRHPWGNAHYRSDLSLGDLLLVGLGGLEPPTSPLSGVRSNRLSYRPDVHPVEARRHPAERYQARTVQARTASNNLCGCICQSTCFVKGGDPAAGSPTATLLRLHPSHEPYRGKRPPHYLYRYGVKLPTSGTTHSHGVTGGVYKARERIHRDVLIRDY
jgi:hypothetical protein